MPNSVAAQSKSLAVWLVQKCTREVPWLTLFETLRFGNVKGSTYLVYPRKSRYKRMRAHTHTHTHIHTHTHTHTRYEFCKSKQANKSFWVSWLWYWCGSNWNVPLTDPLKWGLRADALRHCVAKLDEKLLTICHFYLKYTYIKAAWIFQVPLCGTFYQVYPAFVRNVIGKSFVTNMLTIQVLNLPYYFYTHTHTHTHTHKVAHILTHKYIFTYI